MRIDIPKHMFIFPVLAMVAGFYLAGLVSLTALVSRLLIIIDIAISSSLVVYLLIFSHRTCNTRRLIAAIFMLVTACMFITGLLRNTLHAKGEELDKAFLYDLSRNGKEDAIRLEGRVISGPYVKYGSCNFLFEIDRLLSGDVPGDIPLSGLKTYITSEFDGDRKIIKDGYFKLEAFLQEGSLDADPELRAVSIKLCPDQKKATIYRLRSDIYRCVQGVLYDNLDEECLHLASALLLGDKTLMSDSQLSDFKKSGLYHILAVSGLHVSILSLMVFGLTIRLTGNSRIALSMVLFLLIIFNLVIGFRASSLRASIMVVMVLISNQMKREASRIHVFTVPFCGILLVFPQYFRDVGFWLSFMSIFCIFFILPLLNCALRKIFVSRPRLAKNNLFKIILATFAINLLIWPLVSHFFGYIQLLSPLSNLFVLPVFPLLMSLLFSGGISALFSTVLGGIFFKVSWPLLKYISMTAKVLSGLDHCVILVKISRPALVFYYLFITLLLVFVYKRLKNNENEV